MFATVLPLTALLAGTGLLLAGSGLLGTLLVVRGGLEGFDAPTLGWVMSGYFAGFFLGTFLAPALIRRVGPIRAFAFYAALCAATVLLHPIWLDPWVWALLRFITGAALVGLYTVIESWLNAQPPPEQRSRVFAIYMAINLAALAAGQALLVLGVDRGFTLFSLVAILICLATLPVSLTRLTQPELPETPRLGLGHLYRIAPAAAASAGLSGLAMGAFWGLAPVYASGLALGRTGIASLMIATILGGAALQWPLGRWSDRSDRRIGLILTCSAAAAVASLAPLATALGSTAVHALFFVYGGLAFSIYPMSVAHMLDTLPRADLLSGCSSLLLLHGVGAALGPALAGMVMGQFGTTTLPLYFAGVWIVLAVYLLRRVLAHRRTRAPFASFHPMLRTTPSALQLLPETPDPTDKEPQ